MLRRLVDWLITNHLSVITRIDRDNSRRNEKIEFEEAPEQHGGSESTPASGKASSCTFQIIWLLGSRTSSSRGDGRRQLARGQMEVRTSGAGHSRTERMIVAVKAAHRAGAAAEEIAFPIVRCLAGRGRGGRGSGGDEGGPDAASRIGEERRCFRGL